MTPLEICHALNATHSTLTALLASNQRLPLAHFIPDIETEEERLNDIRDQLARAAPENPLAENQTIV